MADLPPSGPDRAERAIRSAFSAAATGPEGTSCGALDPDAIAICRHLAGVLFPWDITRALELALLKTFCVPSIAGLLDRTGEFEKRPRKRYDDTGLMVAELLRHGPDSAAGSAVIARMNRIHGHYAIGNDDFLYVLSTFVAEPIRWLERYSWRPLSAIEQQALYRFWRRVGQRMGLVTIPDSLGWPLAPPALQSAIRAALRVRSRLANGWQRLVPPRGSRFYSERPTPSYGARFQLEQLGPPPLLQALNRPRWQGSQRRIGLTGGIASGKSSVGRLLSEQGLPLLDADVFAREALAPGSPSSQAVLERYGEQVRAIADDAPTSRDRNAGRPSTAAHAGKERGRPRNDRESSREATQRRPEIGACSRDRADAVIDRAALGRIVFRDNEERRWLERLVHPLVRERFEAELTALAEAPVVVLVIPLLFEAGLEGLCSEIWLVDCEPDQQLQRLMARDGLGESDARDRLAAQWPLERKRPLAEVVIDNRGGPQALGEAVAAALRRPAQQPGAAGPSIHHRGHGD